MSKYNMKLDKDQIKTLCKLENVIGQLINIDVNPSWLSNIYHREFLDSMYIVYRLDATCIFGGGSQETKTMLINNDIVQYMAVEEQDLYLAAINNIKPEILSMSEMLGFDLESDIPLLTISVSGFTYGAFAIVSRDIMDSVAEKIGNDFILLPGSVHDMYATNLNFIVLDHTEFMYNKSFIRSMAYEVSHTVKNRDEYLTSEVYIYNRELKELRTLEGDQSWKL